MSALSCKPETVRWLFGCLVLLGAIGSTPADAALVGKIDGKFDVSAGGSAHYSLPIAVPPGTRGIQPELSLQYDSNGVNGPVGMGWALGGLSAITRCPRTLAQDGSITAVDFQLGHDRLCLDGERLIGKAGSYGQAGSEYRTEHDTFARVLGSIAGPGGWANQFGVDLRNGRHATYGYVDSAHDARIEAQGSANARVWPIALVSDHDGNVMRFSYGEDSTTGEFWPTSITYAENGVAGVPEPGFARVEFSYSTTTPTRPDITRLYFGGSLVTSSKLLTKITSCLTTTTCSQANTVTEYRLAYETSPDTRRSRLISITECGANNDCLPQTTFTWQSDSPPGWLTNSGFRLPDRLSATDTPNNVDYAVAMLADVNADGYPDFVEAFKGTNKNSKRTFLNSPTGFATTQALEWVLPTFLFSNGKTRAMFIDLDGDGYPELVEGFKDDNSTTTNTWKNMKGGVSGVLSSAWQLQSSWTLPGILWDYFGTNSRQVAQLIDLNGDGFPDYVWAFVETGGQVHIETHLNTGSGFSQTAEPANGLTLPGVLWNYQGGYPRQIAALVDVNGDGLPDYVLSYNNGSSLNRATYLNTGTSFVLAANYQLPDEMWDGVNTNSPSRRTGELVDVNGDGLVDFVKSYRGTSGSDLRHTWLNTGAGLNAATGTAWVPADSPWTLPCNLADDTTGTMLQHAAFADVNGDGLVDVVEDYVGLTGTLASHVYLNYGAGFLPVSGYQLPSEIWSSPNGTLQYVKGTLADVNGDGTVDYAMGITGSSGTTVRATYINAILVGDLVAHIQDGLAAALDITYQPITQPSVYAKYPSGSAPLAASQRTIIAPLYVVSRYTSSDGIGGVRATSFSYAEFLYDVLLRRGLGLATKYALDEARNLLTTTTYGQTFPEDGTLKTTTVLNVATSHPVSNITSTWNHTATSGSDGTYYFTFLQHSTEVKTELNNVQISQIDTSLTYDSFGNVLTKGVSSSDGYSSLVTTTYSTTNATDLSSWLISLPVSVTVTGTAPGYAAPQPIRKKSFVFPPGTGRLTQQDVEPNDPQLRVTTAFSYDSFGNPNASTVSGPNFVTRSASSTFDGYGRFPVIKVNELGQSVNYGWNAGFGVVTTQIGPNSQIPATTFTYDSLGRSTGGAAPGGSPSTVISRAMADPNSPCPALAKMIVNTQTTGAPSSFECLDAYARTIRKQVIGFDGTSSIYSDTQFDTVGRVVRTSRPYFSADTPRWTQTSFDVLDRPLTVTLPTSGTGNSTTTIDYSIPLATKTTDPLGHTRTEIGNTRGDIVQVIDVNNQSNRYTYDAFRNLVKIIDAVGNTTTAQFDLEGHRTILNDPDSGATAFDYDALGELTHTRDARTIDTTVQYDKLGRTLSRVDPEGTSAWVYDTASNGIGKLTSESGPEAQYSRSLTYDSLGRTSTVTTSISGSGKVFTFGYDTYSRLQTITYPSLFGLTRVYNSSGYLSSIQQLGGTNSTVFWTAQTMSAEGQIKQELLGTSLTTQNNYDPNNGLLLSTYTGPSGTATVQSNTYAWDILGNLTSRADTIAGQSETFAYDSLNRLTTVTEPVQAQTTSITYDYIGNITSKTGVGTYTYPAAGAARPHAATATSVGSKTYLYDAAGNLTGYGGQSTLTYSSFGKPRTIAATGKSGTYTYDANRQLIKRVETDTGTPSHGGSWVFVGAQYEEFTSAGVTEFRNYIEAAGRQVAIYTTRTSGSPDLKYLHVDHLGSTQVVTDSAGTILERQSYDAHGLRRNTNWTPPSATLFSQVTPAFTSHQQFDLFGLVYMKARMYSPVLGRFLNPDSIVQFPFSTQGLNRYTYVDNSPLSFVDPDGHNLSSWLRRQKGTFAARVLEETVTTTMYVSMYLTVWGVPWVGQYLAPSAASFASSLADSGFQAAMNGEDIGQGMQQGFFKASIAGLEAFGASLVSLGADSGGSVLSPGQSANGGFGGVGTCPAGAMCLFQGPMPDPGQVSQPGTLWLSGIGENGAPFIFPTQGRGQSDSDFARTWKGWVRGNEIVSLIGGALMLPFEWLGGAGALAEEAEWLIPKASNARLQRAFEALFQETDQLPGGTAGAIRHELETGELTGGLSHIQKGIERASQLGKILREEDLSGADREAATKVLKDLQDVLGGR